MNKQAYKLLNGNWLSSILQAEIKQEVESLKSKYGRPPGLGVILVGNNPASKSYVARKEKVAQEKCGFSTNDIILPEDCSKEQLSHAVDQLNKAEDVDGILLQLPLPLGLKQNEFIDQILPEKDADGLHPVNQGLMLRNDGTVRPCTPLGCLSLIDLAYSDIQPKQEGVTFSDLEQVDLSGKQAVIIGRSMLVGKPLHSMLLSRNCTVTQAHSKTKNIEKITSAADILIAAVGVPGLVKENWVKSGAVVIDVGISRSEEGKLVGDVDFDSLAEKTSAITPVPGGVGPMTVAMLMKNTLESFKKNNQ